ncbi:ATP synthase subunit B family protein [Streptomyces albidoflavus]|uniref:hypothetical protein n=1 Tax=Streptomyces albidoflavus TaxID=1886 RepID=UPI00188CA200|nr:hypothetical protein [Streptomyces albidoflavus]MBF4138234.1 hypothetical protein [Streptomyces albidoflavus]
MTDSPTSTSVDTPFGLMNVQRVETRTAEPRRNWTTTYNVQGPRVSGLVHIEPYHGGTFEVLPSRFLIRVVDDPWDEHQAHFTVNGVSISRGTRLLGVFAPEDVDRFSLHRFDKRSGYREEISDAGQARASTALQAVLGVHMATIHLVWAHANAHADHHRPSRRAEIAESLREAQERAAEAQRDIEALHGRLDALAERGSILDAQRRAGHLLQALLDTTAPGHHQILCSASLAGNLQTAILLVDTRTGATFRHDEASADFTALLAYALAQTTPGGLVMRSRVDGQPEEVRGWRLRAGRAWPLTAAEVFDAYCTDHATGDLLSPEPGVEYRAGTPLDDDHRPEPDL